VTLTPGVTRFGSASKANHTEWSPTTHSHQDRHTPKEWNQASADIHILPPA